MKALLCAVALLFLTSISFAQNVYQIRADTVRIYNTCDTAELVLENRTKDTLGFLFNKGKGRTEFRRLHLQQIGTKLAITGQDTLDLSGFNLETLQTVMNRGNTTTRDLVFGGISSQSPALSWGYNSDYWRIFVESPQDTPAGDMIFETGDNDQEGWMFRSKNGTTPKQVLNIQPEGTFTFLGNNILHEGNHAPGSAFSQTLTGANVFSTITTNASGHVTQLSTRALTPADIGAAAASGSGSYIQNQTAADQPSSGFRITGLGRSNSQFQIVKDGSNSIVSAFQLFNAASTRGANIQLDGNTNPGLAFWVHDGTAWQNRLTLAANGSVGIGTATPIGGLHVVNNTSGIVLESTRAYASTSGGLFGAYNRGTPTGANQRLGGVIMGALTNGTEYRPSSQIDVLTSAAWTNDASQPSYMRFMTTPEGAFQPLERMRIAADGTVKLFNIPALGTTGTNFLTSNGGVISSRTAAQVLTDLGAAPASGSGNYIKNQQAAAQTENFWINGIGRTEGGRFLVQKNGSDTINAAFHLGNAALTNGANFQLTGGSVPGLGTWVHSGTAWVERMRINADGNVGIGTSSPGTLLHVNGAATVNSLNGSGASTLQVSSGSSAQALALIGGATGPQSNQGGAITLFSGAHASQPGMIAFYTGAGTGGTQQPERMRISAAGNVGINTTTPAARLDVGGNIRATNGRLQATNGTIVTDMYYSSADGVGTIGTTSYHPLAFVAGGQEIARITPDGYLGIGVTNPSVPLDVGGVANFGSELNMGGALTISGSREAYLTGLNVSGNSLFAGSTNIDAAGKLGIGVSIPAHSLDVQGSVGFSGRTVTATTTLTATDCIIQVNNSAAATINLPAVAGSNKKIYIIKKISGASLNVTIDPSGSELIDGATTKALTLQYSSVIIYCTGAGWAIVGAYAPGMTL